VLRALPADRRPLVFTKFGHHLVDGRRTYDGTEGQVVADAEHALRTLGVESIDLFQLHWPVPQPVEETAGACARLIAAGKVRHIGLCNAGPELLSAWQRIVPVASVQNAYHLFRPGDAQAVLPACLASQVGFLAHSPLYRGLLTGTWGPDKTFPAGDHRGERDDFRGPRLARYLAAVEELRPLAEAEDLDVAGLAIGCLLVTEGLTGCIVGARTQAQGAALGGLAMPVKAATLDAVDAVVARCLADLPPTPALPGPPR
jgi:aryl-alcohol dehydrogenase-like predicted oxidoreductase